MIIPVVIIYYTSSSIGEPEQHKTNTHLAIISLLVVRCVTVSFCVSSEIL